MEATSLLEVSAIEPENLIGTKWAARTELLGNKMMVEFLDKTNCIFTLKPNECPMTYTVTGGRIFFSDIGGAFELKGHVLYNNDLPAFEKAA